MKDISGRFRKTLILTFLICTLLSFLSYIFIYLFSVSDRRDSVQEEQSSVVVSSQAEDIPSSDEDEISYETESSGRTAQDLPVDESSSLSRSDVSQSADRRDAQSAVPYYSEETESSVSAGMEEDSEEIIADDEPDCAPPADVTQEIFSQDSLPTSENISIPQPPSILYAFAYETDVIITGSDDHNGVG